MRVVKMKIWIILLLIIGITFADVCIEINQVGETCTIITPVLDCSTNATIVKESTGATTTQAMVALYGDTYSFDISLDEDNWLIILCDNTTSHLTFNDSIANKIDSLNDLSESDIWTYAGDRSLSTPSDYQADLTGIATQTDVNDLETHGDATWVCDTTDLATQTNVTDIINNITDTECNVTEIWNYTTRTLTDPDSYKADVSDLATQDNVTDILSNITSSDCNLTGIAYQDNLTVLCYQDNLTNIATQENVTTIIEDIANISVTADINETEVAIAVWDAELTDYNNTDTFGYIVQAIYDLVDEIAVYGSGCC